MVEKRQQRRLTRSRALFAAMAALALALLPQIAIAQNYPNKPVRLILPFGAGGVADVYKPSFSMPIAFPFSLRIRRNVLSEPSMRVGAVRWRA